ncbi:hypothetical protein HYS00_05240 [Candidatus Microgenomates bacterium]|nr:hypothetical protein [Candidatus Microgenomates bacterium]
MRIFGLLLVIVGLGVAVFVGYLFMKDRDRLVSPVPQENGVKVIYITPTPEQ